MVETGAGVTGLSAGDQVMGYSAQPWTGVGVFAEAASMSAALLTARPVGLDTNVAASLPVVALTADLALGDARLAYQMSTSAGAAKIILKP